LASLLAQRTGSFLIQAGLLRQFTALAAYQTDFQPPISTKEQGQSAPELNYTHRNYMLKAAVLLQGNARVRYVAVPTREFAR